MIKKIQRKYIMLTAMVLLGVIVVLVTSSKAESKNHYQKHS